MKTCKFTILSVAVGMILAACNETDSVFENSGKKGAFLSIESARIVAPEDVVFKSSTDLESDPVTVFEDLESGTSISVTTTVSPMSSDVPQTRVTEKTSSNLGNFKVDGYLGDDILTCRWADNNDKSERRFIDGLTATKSTDGYWYFASPTPRWRSCVDHHFWAYDGTPVNFTVPITDASKEVNDFSKASFSYTNDGSEDLIVAYQHHYWVDEVDGTLVDGAEGTVDAYPVENFKFQHALSEVVIDFSNLEFKQYKIYHKDDDLEDPVYELVDGQFYIDKSDTQQTIPEDMKPRLTVQDIKLMTPSKGTCNATVGNNGLQFDWTCSTSQDDYIALECTGSNSKSMFAIPQSPQNNVVMFMIYDKWRDITTPFFIQLPALSDNAEWQPGYRYTYKLRGTLVAPYYTPLGYFDTGFVGKGFQSVAVMKNLMSKYVKKIRVTWTGLMAVSSRDTPGALIYLTNNNKPNSTDYPMADISDTDAWKDRPNVGFIANDLHGEITYPVTKGEITPTDHYTGNHGPAYSTAPANLSCKAEFEIPDTFDPPITFWILYDGDNNGNADWNIHDMDIEVLEFKSPIQIIP